MGMCQRGTPQHGGARFGGMRSNTLHWSPNEDRNGLMSARTETPGVSYITQKNQPDRASIKPPLLTVQSEPIFFAAPKGPSSCAPEMDQKERQTRTKPPAPKGGFSILNLAHTRALVQMEKPPWVLFTHHLHWIPTLPFVQRGIGQLFGESDKNRRVALLS